MIKRILLSILLALILSTSILAMTEAEFTKVKINDVVFLDFSKFSSSMKSITGKVIDKGVDWAVVYEVRNDGYWSCTRWNRYYITSILTPAPLDNSAEVVMLRQEIANLKAKIQALVLQIMDAIR